MLHVKVAAGFLRQPIIDFGYPGLGVKEGAAWKGKVVNMLP